MQGANVNIRDNKLGLNISDILKNDKEFMINFKTLFDAYNFSDTVVRVEPFSKNGELENRLIYICKYGMYDELIEILNKDVNPNFKDNRGFTPIFYAFKSKKINFIELLLKKGAVVEDNIISITNNDINSINSILELFENASR